MESELLEYDLISRSSRVLRSGYSPVVVDGAEFICDEHGPPLWVASFAQPNRGRFVMENASVRGVFPGTRDVVVSIDLPEPPIGKSAPTLWRVSLDTGEKTMLLDQEDFVMYANRGCLSWYPQRWPAR